VTEAATPSSDPPAEPPRSAASLRQDVISGYVLAAARVGAWAGVTAYIYREMGPIAFGVFALLRGTITILSYTSLGVAPAMVHRLAIARNHRAIDRPVAVADDSESGSANDSAVPYRLDYAAPSVDGRTEEARVVVSGLKIAAFMSCIGILVSLLILPLATKALARPTAETAAAVTVAALLGVGVAVRVLGEPASAVLQSRGRLEVDNSISAASELLWVLAVVVAEVRSIHNVAEWWIYCGVIALMAKLLAAWWYAPDLRGEGPVDRQIQRQLLRYGSGVTVAQTADFLYAPCSLLVIQSLLGSAAVAAYAPLVQIDAALLLVVAGIAGAVFPRAAKASAAGDLRSLRRLYLRGTLASFALLGVAAIVTIVFSDRLFRLWLGQAPPDALAILPLVLIHTVVGGSSGVGRAVLLGMGKVRPFVTASLIAGFGNVILGAVLAGPVGLGLKGIVIATIAVVVARCAIWMPWYVLRLTKDEP
jgi:O-antigen/teichoic acid export membrane protein